MALQDQMGKMIGPLPMGAWVAVIGGGLALAYYSRRNAAGDPEPVESTANDPGVGLGGSGEWIDLNAPATPETPTNSAPTTNDEWATLAMLWFQSNGYDMALASQAIANYLAGQMSSKDVQGWA